MHKENPNIRAIQIAASKILHFAEPFAAALKKELRVFDFKPLINFHINATTWQQTPDGKLAALFLEYRENRSLEKQRLILRKMLRVLKIKINYWDNKLAPHGFTVEDALSSVIEKPTNRTTLLNQGIEDPAWLITLWQTKKPIFARYFYDRAVTVPEKDRNSAGWRYLQRMVINELKQMTGQDRQIQHKRVKTGPLLSTETVMILMAKTNTSHGRLARAIGVSRPFISQILNRDRPIPVERQKQIMNYFEALAPRQPE